MKAILPTAIFLATATLSFAQENSSTLPIRRNTVYAELAGQSLYYSLGFDRLINTDKKHLRSYSTGISVMPLKNNLVISIPLAYNYIFGRKNCHLEVGLGVTPTLRHRTVYWADCGNVESRSDYIALKVNELFTYATPRLGYRFQKPGGGIFFRATFTPPVAGITRHGAVKGFYTDIPASTSWYAGFFPLGGISAGWTF